MLRIEQVTMPSTSTISRDVSLDLDGDETPDNNAGLVSAAMHTMAPGFDLSTPASARLAADVVWDLKVDECSDGTARVSIGTGEPLTGKQVDGRIIAHGTDGRMPISTLWDAAGTFPGQGWLRTQIAEIDLRKLDDGRWEGRIGMGFATPELIAAIADPLAPYFDEHELFLEYLDVAPVDGHITVREMREANIMNTLLAPDLKELGTSFAVGFVAK